MSKAIPYYALTGLFLLIIFGVPIAQGIIDVKIEEEDHPLAFVLFDKNPDESLEKHLRTYEESLEENSTFEQNVRPYYQLGSYLALSDMGEKALRAPNGAWFFYQPGIKYLTQPYFRDLRTPPSHDPVATVVDFAQQLKRRNVALLVVPIPGKASIHSDQLASGVKPAPAVSQHTSRFIAELQRYQVDVVELHALFLKQRRTLYLKTDTHWNGEGVRLASGAIAQRIRSMNWYRQQAIKPRYERQPVDVDRQGDIPRMTRLPEQQRLFGKERVTVYRVRDKATGEPYQDPEDPSKTSLLLLGDSFSRIFQTDEPEAAGLIANIAHDLQIPLTSIVNDGGAGTLVRQELARDLDQLQGKKLVVWAFIEREIRFDTEGWRPVEL